MGLPLEVASLVAFLDFDHAAYVGDELSRGLWADAVGGLIRFPVRDSPRQIFPVIVFSGKFNSAKFKKI